MIFSYMSIIFVLKSDYFRIEMNPANVTVKTIEDKLKSDYFRIEILNQEHMLRTVSGVKIRLF